MDTALLTAIVALVTALSGIVFTYRKLQNERDQWQTALESQQSQWQQNLQNQRDQWQKEHDADLRSKFLHNIVIERYKTYPAVLKILGTVRDIPDPHEKHWQSLENNPEQLLPVADALIGHLYSEAGLVMSMETRNALLSVYYACHIFQEKQITRTRLVQEFFQARRQLRSDLQIEDLGKKSELAKIRENFSS